MVKTRAHLRPRSGVALIDAIVATIILGVALAVIVGLTAQSIGSQSQGERMQIGAMLADEQLNLVLARGPDEYGATFPLSGACDPPFEAYSYALTLSGGAGGEPYTVQAVISWRSPSGRDEKVSVQTLMAPRTGPVANPARTVPTELVPESTQ
jgi:hypothetical protein